MYGEPINVMGFAISKGSDGLSSLFRPKGKKPLIEWKEFQTRRASEVELRSWLQKWPEMNLGIVTGTHIEPCGCRFGW